MIGGRELAYPINRLILASSLGIHLPQLRQELRGQILAGFDPTPQQILSGNIAIL